MATGPISERRHDSTSLPGKLALYRCSPADALQDQSWLLIHMVYVPQDPKATSPSPCDVLALQKCLEQNKGDRKKCVQEVQAFQQACSKAKIVI